MIDGEPESISDREYLEMENLRLNLDKEFMESEGILALLRAERARQKKRKAQDFFRRKKAEKLMKELGRPPFCELINNEYVFHPLEIPPFEGPRRIRRFMSLEEFQEEKKKNVNNEWWDEGRIPWTAEERNMVQEWEGAESGLDDS